MTNPFDAVVPHGIDASSASDIWIISDQRSGPFTEHFNGTTWSVVTIPVRMTINAVLDLAPTNAWSVGDEVAHWNGTSWKVVPNATSYNSGNHLEAITALSPTDLWAVGYSYPGPAPVVSALVEHFNGTSWSVVPTPSFTGTYTELKGVSSAASGHVYAVGVTFASNTSAGKTVVLENDNG